MIATRVRVRSVIVPEQAEQTQTLPNTPNTAEQARTDPNANKQLETMMIVSLTPTDPAKQMNDWQIEVRIAQLEQRIAAIESRVDHNQDALTPALLRERIELSIERNHLFFEQVSRKLDEREERIKYLEQEQQNQPARQWKIIVNKDYRP